MKLSWGFIALVKLGKMPLTPNRNTGLSRLVFGPVHHYDLDHNGHKDQKVNLYLGEQFHGINGPFAYVHLPTSFAELYFG